MEGEHQENRRLDIAARKIELIEGLQRAIDRNYRRLLQAARADWERLFAGKDPSDACVSIRVSSATAIKAPGLPGSGFLKLRKPEGSKGHAKHSRPRFAQ